MVRSILIATLLFISSSFAFSQNVKDLVQGTLPNGFKYYVLNNNTPSNIIEMRLVVKAGKDNEGKGQLELSHLLEHMAYEGTKHFPGNSMQIYTGKKGLRFGSQMTAHTGTESTRYHLTIPANDPGLLDSSFLMLRDWAHGLSMDPVKIDAQRGVVINELNMRANSSRAKMEQDLKNWIATGVKAKLSYYERVKDNLQNFKHDELLKFYNEWYRPNLQAIIIVGNIDLVQAQRKIVELFSDLVNPTNIKSKSINSNEDKLTAHPEKRNMLVLTSEEKTDIDLYFYQKEETANSLAVSNLGPSQFILDKLYYKLVATRIAQTVEQYKPPYKNASARFDRERNMVEKWLKVSDISQLEMGVKSLLTLLEQINKYGFTESELNNSKKAILTSLIEKDSKNSRVLAANLIDQFIGADISASVEDDALTLKKLMQEIDLNRINVYSKKLVLEKDKLSIAILAPDRERNLLPDKKTILQWFDFVKQSTITPFVSSVPSSDSLMLANEMPKLPKAIYYMERKVKSDSSMIRLQLKNGVNVILRQSIVQSEPSYKNKIKVLGYSDGGSRLYNGLEKSIANYCGGIIVNNGVGRFSGSALQKYLKGKSIRVTPYVSEKSEIINASSSVEDAEEMLQLIYLYFMSPRVDEVAFDHWKSGKLADIKNKKSNNNTRAFDDMVAVADIPNVLSQEELEQITQQKAIDIYKQRFVGGKEFTFYVTGDFNLDTLRQLVFKYLGNLPALPVKYSKEVADSIITNSFPTKKDSKILYLGNDDQAEVQLYLPGNNFYEYSLRNDLMFTLLGDIFQNIIFDRLRTKEGISFSPKAYAYLVRSNNHLGQYKFGVQFKTLPKDYSTALEAVLDEFIKLRDKGCSQEVFSRALGETRRILKIKLGYGISPEKLKELYSNKENSNEFLEQAKLLDTIALTEINEWAKKYLSVDNLQKYVMLPESYKPKQ